LAVFFGFRFSPAKRPDEPFRFKFEVCGLNLPVGIPTKSRASLHAREQTLTVTVVICTRNRPVLLQKCLAAVARLIPSPNQILVVDNSEGNGDTRKVAQDYGARYIIEPVPGLSRARNRGLAECDTDIVAFLDDDVTPASDWLGLLLSPFADEQTAASAGRVITPDSVSLNGRRQSPINLGSKDPHWFEIATFGGLGLGANMALRRRFCASGNFFDERLGRGAPFEIGEESYAFAWLLSHGYRVAYLPSAVVYHPPIHRHAIEHEARNSITYWLLLFSEFPGQRTSLIRFIVRRLRRKPLDWSREPQEPGEIVTSGWRVLCKAGIEGLWLFLRTPRPKNIQRPRS
jgi:glycosyltransferase involved in cell wall biosynthesis